MGWQDEILKLFSKYGSVKTLVVPGGKQSKNKGYAFISFDDIASVQAVFNDLPNVKLRAKEVCLEVGHQRHGQKQKTTNWSLKWKIRKE